MTEVRMCETVREIKRQKTIVSVQMDPLEIKEKNVVEKRRRGRPRKLPVVELIELSSDEESEVSQKTIKSEDCPKEEEKPERSNERLTTWSGGAWHVEPIDESNIAEEESTGKEG
jgi:hypothetical protein